MALTVKELSALSGASVRALHFYHEIGLLRPAYLGHNGYRYYEEKELLRLQQILFYKELGFSLKDVQELLSQDFDPLEKLQSHKDALLKKIAHSHRLIQTIDQTMAHLKGEKAMKTEDIFQGFDPKKQNEYEEYWMKQGPKSQALVEESRRRTKNWQKEDYAKITKETQQIHQDFVEAIDKNLAPTSKEVQKIVERHHRMIENFFSPSRELYQGLGELYVESPDFRKTFDRLHPQLASFMAKAMTDYAQKNFA